MNWYVVNCKKGTEERLAAALRRSVDKSVLQDVFVFYHERMRRYLGEWHTERKMMFPGYVFLESGQPQKLSKALAPYREFAEVLEEGEWLLPVSPEEQAFFHGLCRETKVLGMSRGYILDGVTHVTEGPLKGKEEVIKKIDRHRRTAVLEPLYAGRRFRVEAGLEIVKKG